MVASTQKGFAFKLGFAIKHSFIDYFTDFAFREKMVNLCLDDTLYTWQLPGYFLIIPSQPILGTDGFVQWDFLPLF